jgi:hypothetical protein
MFFYPSFQKNSRTYTLASRRNIYFMHYTLCPCPRLWRHCTMSCLSTAPAFYAGCLRTWLMYCSQCYYITVVSIESSIQVLSWYFPSGHLPRACSQDYIKPGFYVQYKVWQYCVIFAQKKNCGARKQLLLSSGCVTRCSIRIGSKGFTRWCITPRITRFLEF